MGVGFPGSHLHTVLPIPQEGKQPTVQIYRGKAQVTLSYKDGKCFLSPLTKKRTPEVFQALNGTLHGSEE